MKDESSNNWRENSMLDQKIGILITFFFHQGLFMVTDMLLVRQISWGTSPKVWALRLKISSILVTKFVTVRPNFPHFINKICDCETKFPAVYVSKKAGVGPQLNFFGKKLTNSKRFFVDTKWKLGLNPAKIFRSVDRGCCYY